jgi:hypothetical protein
MLLDNSIPEEVKNDISEEIKTTGRSFSPWNAKRTAP